MWLVFRPKNLIYQLKANLDVKSLFGKGTHLLDPKIRQMSARGMYWKNIPRSFLFNDSLAIEIEAIFLKMTIGLS